ncbi:MAG: restriction endonuclease [Thermoanaerobaculia bacterium]
MHETNHKKALVVTKEEDLGSGVVEVLRDLGYDCTRVRAGSASAREEVQDELIRNRFDLIVAQQRMSPYSVADLLRDVETIDGTGLPAVVCLADDDSYHDTFIRKGGSGFVPLEPGVIDLQQAVAKGLLQAQEARQSRKVSKANVLRVIDRFTKEKDFQEFILRIFRELEYSGVRPASGGLERGKDIVCWERNRMRHSEYVGVQIKLGDVHGSSGTSGITELRRQAVEAFGISVPFADGDHDLDKFVIVASGTINESARDKLSGLVRNDHFHRRLYFLDREEIADLVVSSCPSLLTRIE